MCECSIDSIRFQSTRPSRDGTLTAQDRHGVAVISIHPPLAGRDVPVFVQFREKFGISIHPPLAGRDLVVNVGFTPSVISIHPPLAGRDEIIQLRLVYDGISIHPPLAGRDFWIRPAPCQSLNFNPPAPRGTGRQDKG